jgi:hypothetical protein
MVAMDNFMKMSLVMQPRQLGVKQMYVKMNDGMLFSNPAILSEGFQSERLEDLVTGVLAQGVTQVQMT